MSLEVLVDIQVSNVSLKRLPEIKQDIELLSGQPLVDVHPGFKDKKLDYEGGYRIIRVTRDNDNERLGEVLFKYSIIDYARVEGTVHTGTSVGSKLYTQEEVEKLRRS